MDIVQVCGCQPLRMVCCGLARFDNITKVADGECVNMGDRFDIVFSGDKITGDRAFFPLLVTYR